MGACVYAQMRVGVGAMCKVRVHSHLASRDGPVAVCVKFGEHLADLIHVRAIFLVLRRVRCRRADLLPQQLLNVSSEFGGAGGGREALAGDAVSPAEELRKVPLDRGGAEDPRYLLFDKVIQAIRLGPVGSQFAIHRERDTQPSCEVEDLFVGSALLLHELG